MVCAAKVSAIGTRTEGAMPQVASKRTWPVMPGQALPDTAILTNERHSGETSK
jgi:hypothetical protein